MVRILSRFALPLAVEGYITAHVPAKRLAVDLDSPELASARLRVPITRWIQMTCDLNSQSDVRRVVALQRRAAMEWLTVDQIAREIRQVGIVQSAARAESLSRTVTIYAYNEGSFRSYKDAGAQGVEWLVTEDDVTCEECMALDGKRIGFDGEFVADGISPQHPPLHPRCRCSLIPVIRGANG
jgi:SPP1 gp7 family putative phage head morphogenesis protein